MSWMPVREGVDAMIERHEVLDNRNLYANVCANDGHQQKVDSHVPYCEDWRLAARIGSARRRDNRLRASREIARRLQAGAICSSYCNLLHSFPIPLCSRLHKLIRYTHQLLVPHFKPRNMASFNIHGHQLELTKICRLGSSSAWLDLVRPGLPSATMRALSQVHREQ